MLTVGDIIRFGRDNNFFKALRDEPDLGEHYRGCILVYRGNILNAAGEWEALPHTERHRVVELS